VGVGLRRCTLATATAAVQAIPVYLSQSWRQHGRTGILVNMAGQGQSSSVWTQAESGAFDYRRVAAGLAATGSSEIFHTEGQAV